LNGKERFWIRVRIVSGNYGVDGRFVPNPDVAATKEPVLNAAKENASEVSTRVAVPEFAFKACDLPASIR